MHVVYSKPAELDSANYINKAKAAQSQSILRFISITTEQLSAVILVVSKFKLDECEAEQPEDRHNLKQIKERKSHEMRKRQQLQ